MGSITAVTNDERLLARWEELLGTSGYVVVPAMSDCPMSTAAERADICLLDLESDRTISVAEICALTRAATHRPIIACSAIPGAAEGLAALRAGCMGYCNRQLSGPALLAAIATVLGGEIWAGRQVTEYLLGQAIAVDNARLPTTVLRSLTPRERDVASHVADGQSNKSIAADLGVTERTIKAHLNAIFRKTGISNRVQLAIALKAESTRSLSENSDRREGVPG